MAGHHCDCGVTAIIRCYKKGHLAKCQQCKAGFQPINGCSFHPYTAGFNEELKRHADKKKTMERNDNDAPEQQQNEQGHAGAPARLVRPRRLSEITPNNSCLGPMKFEEWKATKHKAKKARQAKQTKGRK
jgi:hypothetical protein